MRKTTPILIKWLEPKRDAGKESTVKVKDIVRPSDRKKIRPGVTALVKWRSTGRIYKAIILSVLEGLPELTGDEVSTPPPSVNHPGSIPVAAPELDNTPLADPALHLEFMDEDSEDDLPIAALPTASRIPAANPTPPVHSAPPSTPSMQERACSPHQEPPSKEPCASAGQFKKLQEDVSSMKAEITAMKELMAAQNAAVTTQMGTLLEFVQDIKTQGQSLAGLIQNRIQRKAAKTTTPTTGAGMTPRILNPTIASPSPQPHQVSRNISPLYGMLDGDMVRIPVDENNPDIVISKNTYDTYFCASSSATSFARKLMPHFFAEEEMLKGNFDGGVVVTGGGKVEREPLNIPRRKALIAQVEREFSGCSKTYDEYSKLKVAINDKCRVLRRQTHT